MYNTQVHMSDTIEFSTEKQQIVENYTQLLVESLQLDINKKHDNYAEFVIVPGRKYLRVEMHYLDNNSKSITAFVDKSTGDVYKPSSWSSPSTGVRYNVLDDVSREECLKRADWAGGFLYFS